MARNLVIFLLLNFAALGIGSYFIGDIQSIDWYQNGNQAPWTPPGWVFGVAWTLIMACFAVFMAKALDTAKNKQLLIGLYALQLILNIGWNPTFFKYQEITAGLVIISALTVLVAWFTIWGFRRLGNWGLLMLPYLIWLLIATSLNAYFLLNN